MNRVSILIISQIVFFQNAIAYEYSVQHAFCTDYARNRSSIYSSTFQYDLQIAYNRCIKNADILINKHEQIKLQDRKERLRNQIEWEKNAEKRKNEEKQKMREEKKLEEIRNKEVEEAKRKSERLELKRIEEVKNSIYERFR